METNNESQEVLKSDDPVVESTRMSTGDRIVKTMETVDRALDTASVRILDATIDATYGFFRTLLKGKEKKESAKQKNYHTAL